MYVKQCEVPLKFHFSFQFNRSVFVYLSSFILFSPFCFAATITVTNNQDSGLGSLRDALSVYSSGDTIEFASSLSGGQTISLLSSLPPISSNVTINGSANPVIIDGGNAAQAFFVAPSVTAAISNLRLQNCLSQGGSGGNGHFGGGGGGGSMGAGGGLFVSGTSDVTLTNITWALNQSIGGNGGSSSDTNGNLLGAGGGGAGGPGGGNGGSSFNSTGAGGGGGGGGGPGAAAGGDSASGAIVSSPGGPGGAGVDGGFGGLGGAVGGANRASGGGGGGGNAFVVENGDPGAAGTDGFLSVGGIGGAGAGNGGGGGGGSSTPTGTSIGGDGGDGGDVSGGGGGGGASYQIFAGNGGTSGFGAGSGGGAGAGGGGTPGVGGASTFGGGQGGDGTSASPFADPFGGGGGGGGAALGGAIFVQSKSTVTLLNGNSFEDNSIAGGIGGSGDTAGNSGQNGTALGVDIFLQGGGQLNFNMGDSLIIPNPIEGDQVAAGGGIEKSGMGTVTLNGANTYTGTTIVDSGSLIVNGSLITDVEVNPGGLFGGNASLLSGSNLDNAGGTIAPGNSIGTIVVAGNFSQAATGILNNEINTMGETDLLAITGTATLDGTLLVSPEPGVYLNGDSFTFLTTAGGRIGTFSNLTLASNPGGLISGLSVIYGANSATLVISALPPLSLCNFTGNPGRVADYINEITDIPFDSDLRQVLSAIITLDCEGQAQALDQMQPSLFGSLGLVEEESGVLVNGAVIQRLANVQKVPCHCCTDQEPKYPMTLWAEGFYLDGNQDHFGRQVGFDGDTGGIVLGADYCFFESLYLGVAGSYTHSHIDWKDNRGDGDINSYYGGVYSSYLFEKGYLSASILGAYNDYDTYRRIHFVSIDRTAEGSHSGGEVLSNLSGGYNFYWNRLLAQPFVRLDYFYLHENGFREEGAQSLNLDVSSRDSNMLRNELGFNFSYCYSRNDSFIVPNIKLSWIRESRFNSDKRYQTAFIEFQNTNGFFGVDTNSPTRNLFSPGVGVKWLRNLCALSLYYEAAIGGKYWQQYGTLNFDVNF